MPASTRSAGPRPAGSGWWSRRARGSAGSPASPSRERRLARAGRDDDREVRIEMLELAGLKLLGGESLQERGGAQHVAVDGHLEGVERQQLREQPPQRGLREAPVVGVERAF